MEHPRGPVQWLAPCPGDHSTQARGQDSFGVWSCGVSNWSETEGQVKLEVQLLERNLYTNFMCIRVCTVHF